MKEETKKRIGCWFYAMGLLALLGLLGYVFYLTKTDPELIESARYQAEQDKIEIVDRSPGVGYFTFNAKVISPPIPLRGRRRNGDPEQITVSGFSLVKVVRFDDAQQFRCLVRDDWKVEIDQEVDVIPARWNSSEKGFLDELQFAIPIKTEQKK